MNEKNEPRGDGRVRCYGGVGAVRLELMTSCMSSMRSNQLSYVPKAILFYHKNIFLTTKIHYK